MDFRVRYVQAEGDQLREETMAAGSEAELRDRIEAEGGVVLHAKRLVSLGPSRIARFDVAAWCIEMEALLRAGMTAVEAIETLVLAAGNTARRHVLGAVLQSLREGLPLSRALERSREFPGVLVASVKASERTSSLAEALRDYLRYSELLTRLKRHAVSAMLYPAMVTSLGVAISLFLLLYVVPRFSLVFEGMQSRVSGLTRFVLALSQTIRDHGSAIGLAVVVAMAWLLWIAMTGRWRSWAEAIVDAVPPLRRQWDHFRLARLYQSLALMFRGGYTFDESVRICTSLSLGPRMTEALSIVRERVRNGTSASAAMSSAGLGDVTAARLLAVGERTGDFAGVLQAVADRHSQVFIQFIERATRLLEPVLLLAVALATGTLVVMLYLPIFDVAGGLGSPR